MKKNTIYMTALVLVSSILLSGCSSKQDDENADTDLDGETSIETTEDAEPETAPETEAPMRLEDLEGINLNKTSLYLEKEPAYENGTLTLYFLDHEIWYDENTNATVGVISSDGAYTINADIDFDSYPDMKTEEGDYCGIALIPESVIEPGEYKMTVNFEDYRVDFDMTIE